MWNIVDKDVVILDISFAKDNGKVSHFDFTICNKTTTLTEKLVQINDIRKLV